MDEKVNYLGLFWKFFKIGLFTFGGGFAMIPLIEKEVVANEWIDKKEIVDIVAISQTIPGAVAVNMSLFVGYKIAKKMGAIVAVLGCITPSFIIILMIAMFLNGFQDLIIVQHAFTGILSAVVALIIISAYKLSRYAVIDWLTLIITILTVGLLVFSRVEPIFAILGGAFTGILIYYLFPKKVRSLYPKVDDKK